MDSDIVVAEIEPEPVRPARINGRPSKKSLQAAQRTLNDNQMRFAVWLSMPTDLRRPSSQKKLAAELGVAEMTLVRWSKDPNVIMACRWLQLQAAGDVQRVSNVLDFLYETTQDQTQWMKDRLAAAKQWMDAVGVGHAWKYDNPIMTTKEVDEFDLDSLSDDQLWDLYNSRAGELGVKDPAGMASRAVEISNQ